MAHEVVCSICGQKFDRDKIEAVKTSARRYAHATCILRSGSLEEQAKAEQILAEQAKSERDLISLEDYVKKLFSTEDVSRKIKKQINTFHDEYKYTYSGILKSLIYFYEVKGNSLERSNNGIGIVPYVYDEAKMYYLRIWQAQQVNQAKPIEQYIKPPQIIIKISNPVQKKRTRHKLFTFLDEEEANNGIEIQ